MVLSSPAKPGDPNTAASMMTGCPACAGHDDKCGKALRNIKSRIRNQRYFIRSGSAL
jgi:hypothetical protein